MAAQGLSYLMIRNEDAIDYHKPTCKSIATIISKLYLCGKTSAKNCSSTDIIIIIRFSKIGAKKRDFLFKSEFPNFYADFPSNGIIQRITKISTTGKIFW